MCVAEEGGLGIKKLNRFNLALLGKWVLRILIEGKELWIRIIESKYGNFWENVETFLNGNKIKIKNGALVGMVERHSEMYRG